MKVAIILCIAGCLTAQAGLFDSVGGAVKNAVDVKVTTRWAKMERESQERAEREAEEKKALAKRAVIQARIDEERKIGEDPSQKPTLHYYDGSPLPECVAELVSYLGTTLYEKVLETRRCYELYRAMTGENYETTIWYKIGGSGMLGPEFNIEEFLRNALHGRMEGRNPISGCGRFDEGRFYVRGGVLCHADPASFFSDSTREEDRSLEACCKKALAALQQVAIALDDANRKFMCTDNLCQTRFTEAHTGLASPMVVFDKVCFGDTAVVVYNKFLAYAKERPASGGMFTAKRYKIINRNPWIECYNFKTGNHSVEFYFSGFTPDDIGGLTRVSIEFINQRPKIDELREMYVKMGYEMKVEKKFLGNVWKDDVPTPVAMRYYDLKSDVWCAEEYMKGGKKLNKGEQTKYDRDLKLVKEIEEKHMVPYYRDQVSGIKDGYVVQFVAGGPTPNSNCGLDNENEDPSVVKSVLIQDQSMIDLQIKGYNEKIKAEREAAEKEKKEKLEAAEKAAMRTGSARNAQKFCALTDAHRRAFVRMEAAITGRNCKYPL